MPERRRRHHPEPEPDVRGASRAAGDPDTDAGAAGGSAAREGPSTEYAANADPGSRSTGYVAGGEERGRAGDLDPHEPPGQG